MGIFERLMLLWSSGQLKDMTEWEFYEMINDLCEYQEYLP